MCNDGINVLSLFDGMSCGALALRKAGINVSSYFASEIDKAAIRQTTHNFPDTVQLGSVREVRAADLPKIDLLIGGSPCQGFSFAGKQLNFNDPRSALFFEYVRILKEIRQINPDVKFLLENVRMRTEYENVISQQLGLFPVTINSSSVSAQNRVRLYWTNIRTKSVPNLFDTTVYTDIPQPQDKGIYLKDILDSEVEDRYYLTQKKIDRLVRQREYGIEIAIEGNLEGDGYMDMFDDLLDYDNYSNVENIFSKDSNQECATYISGNISNNFSSVRIIPPSNVPRVPINAIQHPHQIERCKQAMHDRGLKGTLVISGGIVSPQFGGGFRPILSGKAPCLLATSCNYAACLIINGDDMVLRRLTPKECCRLQTVPDHYQWICTEPQTYKMLGNGWTVDVIAHILSFLKT